MKKNAFLFAAVIIAVFLASFGKEEKDISSLTFIPASVQRSGDAAKGYEYLIYGDFLKSGFPYDFFVGLNKNGDGNALGRKGISANVAHGYNVVRNADSLDIVIPTCLQCHAQVFEGKLYVGLGNAGADFSNAAAQARPLGMLKMWQTTQPRKYKAVKVLAHSLLQINPQLETEVAGVNTADRLAALLVAHRDPQTLIWSDKPLLDIPDVVVPTDVPAWWLLKKKNAMFYNGFGRGDFGKFLMASNLLTVADSFEAREVDSHFGDVLAYILSIQPPAYTGAVNNTLAARGNLVFNSNCSGCHGTYGANGHYPNLLVAGSVIQTDSLLFKSNQQSPQFVYWFNNSWFANGNNAARLVPGNGYVAPPLDGIWITAPYLHNGSVPTLVALLNSKLRPAYWSRNFSKPEYDYDLVGWKCTKQERPDGKKVYNTTLPGYGNSGHYFGDRLSEDDRQAVIEYLKTL